MKVDSFQQRVLSTWVCLLLLLYQTTTCQGLQGLSLQSNGKYGLFVPLEVQHGAYRLHGRSLLRSGMLPVQGAIKEG